MAYATPPVAVPCMKLSTDSHSDLQLGKQAVIKLSLQLRPSMLNNIKVKIKTQETNTGKSLSYSIDRIDQLTVTFIPVVSGKHILTVTTRDGSDSVTVNVVGKPQIGAVVVPGPYRGHQLQYVRYGARGIVTDNKEEGCVSVLWDGANEPSVHMWGSYPSREQQHGRIRGLYEPQIEYGHDSNSYRELYGVQLDL